jgi:hypothetical protein
MLFFISVYALRSIFIFHVTEIPKVLMAFTHTKKVHLWSFSMARIRIRPKRSGSGSATLALGCARLKAYKKHQYIADSCDFLDWICIIQPFLKAAFTISSRIFHNKFVKSFFAVLLFRILPFENFFPKNYC